MRSNGLDNDTAALQLFSHLEGDALNVTQIGTVNATAVSVSGFVDTDDPLWISGSTGRLPATV